MQAYFPYTHPPTIYDQTINQAVRRRSLSANIMISKHRPGLELRICLLASLISLSIFTSTASSGIEASVQLSRLSSRLLSKRTTYAARWSMPPHLHKDSHRPTSLCGFGWLRNPLELIKTNALPQSAHHTRCLTPQFNPGYSLHPRSQELMHPLHPDRMLDVADDSQLHENGMNFDDACGA